MSQISSINFKKSFSINCEHNDRTIAPSYLISDTGCEFNRNSKEARQLKEQITTKAIKNYENYTGQKFQAKSFEWSAVVNIKPDTTMQYLEELAKHFEEKYGFQCYQIAIHRDEGHIEEGEKIINQHAHMEFVTLDKVTGKNNYQRAHITPKILREIQTEVALILKMERGVDKRITGVKRIEPRKYAQMKEQEKANTKALKEENEKLKEQIEAEKINKAEIKAEFEKLRQESKWQGFDKEYFKKLSAAKKQALETIKNKKELKEIIENIKKDNTKKGFLGKKIDYEKIYEEQEKIIFNQVEQISSFAGYQTYVKNIPNVTQKEIILKEENEKLRNALYSVNTSFNTLKQQLNQTKNYAEKMAEKNQELKQENEKLKLKNANFYAILEQKNIIIKEQEQQNEELKLKIEQKNSELNHLEAKISHLKQKDIQNYNLREKTDLKANSDVLGYKSDTQSLKNLKEKVRELTKKQEKFTQETEQQKEQIRKQRR